MLPQRITLGEIGISLRGSSHNPATLLIDLSRRNLNGEHAEFLQEASKRDGVAYDPVRPYVTFRDLYHAAGLTRRDLTKASVPSAGFLISTEVQESIDILRLFSVTARMGIQIETGLVGDQVVPKVTAKSTPTWLTTESSQASESIPMLAQIAVSPKNAEGFLEYSRQLSKQTNAPQFVARELLRTVGTALDQAIISGPGFI